MAGRLVSETLTKLSQMGDVTLHEPAGDSPQSERARRRRKQEYNFSDCIANLQTPRGPKPVLKTMMTTACERNCHYCVFRAGRAKTKRVTFSPDEMASAFDTMESSGKVDGLFLSSGIIKGSVTTQDKIIDTADIIRNKLRYRGYIHLKIMPGIEYDQLYRSMQLADRISVNLEAPTSARLSALAPKEDLCRRTAANAAVGPANPPGQPTSALGQQRDPICRRRRRRYRPRIADDERQTLQPGQIGAGLLLGLFTGAGHAVRGLARHRSHSRVSLVPIQLLAARLPLGCGRAAFPARWQPARRCRPPSRPGPMST